jgi:hypothetical protein
MLNRIRIFARDPYWIKILSDLNAEISDDGIKFEKPSGKVSGDELRRRVERMKAARITELGADALSETERRLILMLPSGARELKRGMGYEDASKTHTIETLVYNIRKKMGNDFIALKNGIYSIRARRGSGKT